MTVDDDPEVLRAVERDLRRQYGNRYRVVAADSGAAALTIPLSSEGRQINDLGLRFCCRISIFESVDATLLTDSVRNVRFDIILL